MIKRFIHIRKHTRELALTEKMTLDAFQDWQLVKLKRLLNHASKHVKHYREAFWTTDFEPAQFDSISDLCKLPILKRDLLTGSLNADLISDDISSRRVMRTSSGGTSGKPVYIVFDRERRRLLYATTLRYHRNWNSKRRQRTALLWGNVDDLSRNLRHKLNTRLNYFPARLKVWNTNIMTPERFSQLYNELYRFHPRKLEGYTSAINRLAQYMQTTNLPVWKCLNHISCRSEKLTDSMRSTIQAVFQCPVSDIYSCHEVGNIAYECREQIAKHITGEHLIVEAVDDQGSVIYDKPGSLLITDLDNFAMPLIRYQIGDIGTISSQPCPCGRPHSVLKDIIGRSADIMKLPDGRELISGVWDSIFSRANGITQACVRIVPDESLQIDYVAGEKFDKDTESALKRMAQDHVGKYVRIEFRKVNAIPQVKSGKSPTVRRASDEVKL